MQLNLSVFLLLISVKDKQISRLKKRVKYVQNMSIYTLYQNPSLFSHSAVPCDLQQLNHDEPVPRHFDEQ